MSQPVFPEPVIVPLDELERKLALVPVEVVREVLARQGLVVIRRESGRGDGRPYPPLMALEALLEETKQ